MGTALVAEWAGSLVGSVRQRSLLACLSIGSLLMGSFVGEPIARPPVGPMITAATKKVQLAKDLLAPNYSFPRA